MGFLFELPPLNHQWLCRQIASLLALATLLTSLVVFLSYAAGVPLLYGSQTIPMAWLTAVSFALLSFSILAAAGPDTLPLSLFTTASHESCPSSYRGFPIRPMAAFVLLSVAIGTVGYIYFTHQTAASRQMVEHKLVAIADLKVQNILEWRKERLGDAQVIMREPFVGQEVQKFLDGPKDSALRAPLLAWLKSIREHNQGLRVLLLDPKLNVRLAFPEDKTYFGPIAKEHAVKAMHSCRVVLSDLHRSQFSGEIHLDLAIPLGSSCTLSEPGDSKTDFAHTQPIGVIVIEVDPYKCLYPHLCKWPISDHTAETLLIRREGDEVVYLNELRHRENTALILRIPVGRKESLVAAMAAKGKSGVVEGTDYRDVPVLAVIRGVPDTTWFLVAKVDQEELYAPLRERALMTGAVILVLLLAAALGVGLLGRSRDNQWLQGRLAVEQENQLILDSADEGILGLDSEGRHVFVNSSASRMLGYGPRN